MVPGARGISGFFYGLELWVIATTVILLVAGSAMVGHWLGRRGNREERQGSEFGALTAALGLLCLLIAFSFSNALAGYNVRRSMAVEEATALKSAAYHALLLPQTEDGRPAVVARIR